MNQGLLNSHLHAIPRRLMLPPPVTRANEETYFMTYDLVPNHKQNVKLLPIKIVPPSLQSNLHKKPNTDPKRCPRSGVYPFRLSLKNRIHFD